MENSICDGVAWWRLAHLGEGLAIGVSIAARVARVAEFCISRPKAMSVWSFCKIRTAEGPCAVSAHENSAGGVAYLKSYHRRCWASGGVCRPGGVGGCGLIGMGVWGYDGRYTLKLVKVDSRVTFSF
eukprot:1788866-Rhodomonas_salina.1